MLCRSSLLYCTTSWVVYNLEIVSALTRVVPLACISRVALGSYLYRVCVMHDTFSIRFFVLSSVALRLVRGNGCAMLVGACSWAVAYPIPLESTA